MALRLEYPDKYRLWTDLFRGRLDRLFVETREQPALGSRVPLELALPELALPIVLLADVVGRRQKSERFEQGVYVRFNEKEVEKCRRFLGMVPGADRELQGRRAPRIHCALNLRYTSPASGEVFQTRNFSETGLFATCPTGLVVGQRVELMLTLDEGTELPLRAELAWISGDQRSAGLHFVDLTPEDRRALRDASGRVREQQALREADVPRPLVIADDEPEILKLLTVALTRANYQVHLAQNGADAIGLVRELQPKLVLLDILMPGVDGVEICKFMRADAELADIPVIFLSAMQPDVLHQVADEAGASDYMSKPLAMADLINMVGRYLR